MKANIQLFNIYYYDIVLCLIFHIFLLKIKTTFICHNISFLWKCFSHNITSQIPWSSDLFLPQTSYSNLKGSISIRKVFWSFCKSSSNHSNTNCWNCKSPCPTLYYNQYDIVYFGPKKIVRIDLLLDSFLKDPVLTKLDIFLYITLFCVISSDVNFVDISQKNTMLNKNELCTMYFYMTLK